VKLSRPHSSNDPSGVLAATVQLAFGGKDLAEWRTGATFLRQNFVSLNALP
jgi:hypothetical protein